jgi:hypothetical protein
MPIILHQMGQTYGKLPSELLDLSIEDFDINYICFSMGIQFENEQRKKEERKMKQIRSKR